MITKALHQKVQGAGKIAKQIFRAMHLHFVTYNTLTAQSITKRKHQTQALMGGDASRVGHFSATLSRVGNQSKGSQTSE